MVVRERVRKALNEYVDEHRDNIYQHVDKNLIKLKAVIVEKLPDKVMEFLKKRIDDGDDQHDTFLENVMQFVGSISGKLSDDFKEDIRNSTREHIDDATINSSDDLTNLIVKRSKEVILDMTTDSDDEEETKKKKSSFSKNLDLGILKDGKEGIINRIVELIKPPIHESSDDIKKKIAGRLPDQIKSKLIGKISGGFIGSKSSTSDRGIFHSSADGDKSGDKSESKLKKVFGIFSKDDKEGEKKSNFINKIFDKLPDKIEEILTPYIVGFEQSVIEHVETELRSNIFSNDKFKESYACGRY
ncbi:9759_t:CDS:2 [Entrophospora sp. SA101]|nr:10338_t:CDS:2 [Entrophospora sp. SA101]CAJ0828477.1 9759_t:CDS:2 [Entrophospora sp. SA101]